MSWMWTELTLTSRGCKTDECSFLYKDGFDLVFEEQLTAIFDSRIVKKHYGIMTEKACD